MSASKSPVQQCPICRAYEPLEAIRCAECGAALTGIPISGSNGQPKVRRTTRPPLEGAVSTAWEDGETDLYEGALPPIPLQGVLVIMVALVVVAGIAFLVATRVAGSSPFQEAQTPALAVASGPTDVPTVGAPQRTLPPTNTKMVVLPTLALATVTPAPPTPTITPTRGPCIQKARKGDTIYGMAVRCGHHDLAVVDTILELNNMKDAAQLQVGQTVEIPWPTPTGGAVAPEGDTTGTPGPAANIEPTLPVGVIWYKVRKGDTAVGIAYQAHTTMKVLRDLNPEIRFLQCDYSVPSGGPACTLNPMLAEGQRLRIPAPEATATLPPTLTGSETALPTATATFNAPYSQSPSDNMLFESAELPTLRWVASGELAPNEVYLVTVVNTTTGVIYTATTRDLSFQIPAEWQPTDGKRHVFQWSVAVARNGDAGTPTPSAFTTETRSFTWQGR